MAVGEFGSMPMNSSRAIAVSNWSGHDLDKDLEYREELQRALDRLGLVAAFGRLDRELERLNLQAVAHLVGSATLMEASGAL